ncbi:MAG: hypothetical protein R3330_11385, partial [Saprospiraceae bacterium]|nr:hypothetical protein [Saprospiraceae bacterium]
GDKVVDFTTYMESCAGEMPETDTLFVMRDLGTGKISEFVLKGREAWQRNGQAWFREGDERRLVIDPDLVAGQEVISGGDTLRVDRVDETECYRVLHVTRSEQGMRVQESWLGELLLHRIDTVREIRLSTVNQQPLAEYLSNLCDTGE